MELGYFFQVWSRPKRKRWGTDRSNSPGFPNRKMGSQRKISTEHLRRFTCFSLGADSTKKQHQNASPDLDRSNPLWFFVVLHFYPRWINKSSKTDPHPHRIHGTWYMYTDPWMVDFLWLFFHASIPIVFFLWIHPFGRDRAPIPVRSGALQNETHRHQGNDPWVFIITPRALGISMRKSPYPGKPPTAMRKGVSRRGFLKGKSEMDGVLKELMFSPFFFLCMFWFRKGHRIYMIHITWIYFFMFVVLMVWCTRTCCWWWVSLWNSFLTSTNLWSLGD